MKIKLHEPEYVPVYQQYSFLYIPALFLITAVLLDIIMYANMGLPFPRQYLYSLVLMMLLAALLCLTRHKWLQIIIGSVLLGLQLTTCISNMVGYSTCMEIFSLETIKTLYTAFDNASSVDLNLWFLVPIVLVLALYVVGAVMTIWLGPVPKTKRQYRGQIFLCGLLAFVSFFGYTISYSTLPDYQHDVDHYATNLGNTKFLYDTFASRVNNFKIFGSYSFYLDNLLYLLSAKTPVTTALNLQVQDYQPDLPVLSDPADVLGEGYNLITILMETFEYQAINDVTMPYLSEFIAQSCVSVDGYYSMERTCFTDYIAQTGTYVMGQELWSHYGHVQIPFSLANIFNKSGYRTSAFHDAKGETYQRRKIFQQSLGFQNFYDIYDYEDNPQNFHCACNSDEDLFNINKTKIAPADTNFYSYLISVSTHATSANINLRPYYSDAFDYIERPENFAKLKTLYPQLDGNDPDAKQVIMNYLAGTYSFDQGFKALLDYLRETDDLRSVDNFGGKPKKLIETTAIVMFGDHYYYANPGAVKAESDNPRALTGNRCPMIIYNPNQKINGQLNSDNAVKPEAERQDWGQKITRFTSTMDIYKTICSLFGVVTDQQLTYGHSVFDTPENPSIGVGYVNGYVWGMTESGALWRTDDFQHFTGKNLTAAEKTAAAQLVSRTLAAVYVNMGLFQKNAFKDLPKAQTYQLLTNRWA